MNTNSHPHFHKVTHTHTATLINTYTLKQDTQLYIPSLPSSSSVGDGEGETEGIVDDEGAWVEELVLVVGIRSRVIAGEKRNN